VRLANPSAAVEWAGLVPGPTLIAAGLGVLMAAAWLPAMPVTTGAALVALGATGAVVRQFRTSAHLRIALAAHLFVYVSLYLIFVGAVTHAALAGPRNGLSFLKGLDFGMSAGLMLLVVKLSLARITQTQRRD
jgi:hypothetical protein